MIPGPSLGQRALGATKWAVAISAIMQGGRALLLFVLAGILGPEVFGLAARVLAVALILEVAAEFGMTAALIQRPQITDRHCNTVFWSNLVLAAAVAGLAVGGVRGLVWLHGSSDFLETLPFVFGLPLVLAFGNVPRAILTRSLDYKPIARATFLGTAAYLAVSVGLALLGGGVWSVLVGYYANQIVLAGLLWRGSRWRLRAEWGAPEFRELATFGFFKALSKMVESLTNGVDVLVVGGVLGNSAAGIYTLAKRVGGLVVSQIAGAIDTVLFSAFSRLQAEPDRMGAAFLRATRLLALTTSTLLLGIIAAAPLLPPLLGTNWEPAIPIARLLCSWGLVVAVGGTLYHPVLNGLGHSWVPFVIDLFRVVVQTGLLLWWSPRGLVWVCMAMLLQMVIAAVVAQAFVLRALNLQVRRFLAEVGDAILAFIVFAVLVCWVEAWLPISGGWRLPGQVLLTGVALALHLGSIHLVDRQAWRGLVSLALEIAARRRSGDRAQTVTKTRTDA